MKRINHLPEISLCQLHTRAGHLSLVSNWCLHERQLPSEENGVGVACHCLREWSGFVLSAHQVPLAEQFVG